MNNDVWHNNLVEQVSQYGIIGKEDNLLGSMSFYYKGKWIFDQYCNNDIAFLTYKDDCYQLETCFPYDKDLFWGRLEKTMQQIDAYLMQQKLERINGDFE